MISMMKPLEKYVHRDLSWLQFNERVLGEALDVNTPLLERLKFLGITASNLDEFFMIRFPSILKESSSKNLIPPSDLKDQILTQCQSFKQKQSKSFQFLHTHLESAGIQIMSLSRPTKTQLRLTESIFKEQIASHRFELEPLAPNSFASVENLQMCMIFEGSRFVRIPREIPNVFIKRRARSSYHVFFLDDILMIHLKALFDSKKSGLLLRLTRNADVEVDLRDEDPAAIPDLVRKSFSLRERGRPTRLQLRGLPDPASLEWVQKHLKLEAKQIFKSDFSLVLRNAYQAVNEIKREAQVKKSLVFPPLNSQIPNVLYKPHVITSQLRKRDILLHHPYDSFEAFISFLEELVSNPQVKRIDQTIYRTDSLSKVTELLKRAAKTKKVRVFIEPRARFDEINNIQLAEELKDAGVEIVYNLSKLKLHAKITLAELVKEDASLEYFTHLSTGNYNSNTAREYTDIGILTANQAIGRDAHHFFEAVSRSEIPDKLQKLVIAPTKLHRKISSLIQNEIQAAEKGLPARIFVKLNSLVDKNLIDSLYLASQKGVQIQLYVRSACSLIPGISGLSENIRVFSIVDRFLEHSRIYFFQNSQQLYFSSADWMPRNFFSRLEIAFPVEDCRIQDYIEKTLIPTYLMDRTKARELTRSGRWVRRRHLRKYHEARAQGQFEKLMLTAYRGTSLE